MSIPSTFLTISLLTLYGYAKPTDDDVVVAAAAVGSAPAGCQCCHHATVGDVAVEYGCSLWSSQQAALSLSLLMLLY
jgi:hypothetical protein